MLTEHITFKFTYCILVFSTFYGQISHGRSRNVIISSKYKFLGLKAGSSFQVKQLKMSQRQEKVQGKILRVLWNEYIRMSRTKMVDFVCEQNKEIATSPLFRNAFPTLWSYAIPNTDTKNATRTDSFGKRKPAMTTSSHLAETVKPFLS